MVKIRLLDDDNEVDEKEAFITVEKYGSGFAVLLLDGEGCKIAQPFILFLEPGSNGKLKLSLASSPSDDFVERNHLLNQISVSPSH